MNKHKLSLTFNCSDKQFIYSNDLNSTDTRLVLNLPKNRTNPFNQFDALSSDQKQTSNNINGKYYNIDIIQFPNKLND